MDIKISSDTHPNTSTHLSRNRLKHHQFSYSEHQKGNLQEISSNNSWVATFSKEDNRSSHVDLKERFRPIAAKNNMIATSSSIAELVMKGELDNSLSRVTTARPTIIIYPTGNSNDIIFRIF